MTVRLRSLRAGHIRAPRARPHATSAFCCLSHRELRPGHTLRLQHNAGLCPIIRECPCYRPVMLMAMTMTSNAPHSRALSRVAWFAVAAFVAVAIAVFGAGWLVHASLQPSCPTEDSCTVDYRDGAWHIEEIVP